MTWDGTVRSDGMEIQPHDGNFQIVRSKTDIEASFTLSVCPCCREPFPTVINAKRAADILFPLREDKKP